ncbi:hypothetical protein BDV93DRAFT_516225 [Ceratobasidium sp. AG-I]|nr:hypothetical protein BDV93DRAFT_516225 [Ceratobasidium sp. AG-I]
MNCWRGAGRKQYGSDSYGKHYHKDTLTSEALPESWVLLHRMMLYAHQEIVVEAGASPYPLDKLASIILMCSTQDSFMSTDEEEPDQHEFHLQKQKATHAAMPPGEVGSPEHFPISAKDVARESRTPEKAIPATQKLANSGDAGAGAGAGTRFCCGEFRRNPANSGDLSANTRAYSRTC